MSNPIPCLASKELAFWPPRVPHWGPSIRSQETSAQCFIFRSAGRCFSISCEIDQSPNQKKSRKTGKSSVFWKEIPWNPLVNLKLPKKKNTPQIWCQKFPHKKKPDKKVSTSPFNLMVSLRNQTPLLRRGVMVSCEAPQRSRRWSLKFLELIGGSSKCPQSNAGLPKVDMNESKVGSPGVTKLTKNKSPLAEIVWFWVVRASILHLSHCTFWVIFQNIAMFPAPRCGVW